MSDILDVEQVRAMATPAGALWAGERAPTALALARTALEWFARWPEVYAAEQARADALESQINDARTILGAAPDELLSDAAHRVWWKACSDAVGAVREILGATVGQSIMQRATDVMAELRRLRAAEAEPPQVFRAIPRVVVEQSSQFKGRCVRIEIVTSDPAVLALTADQLSRLGLVVCDG